MTAKRKFSNLKEMHEAGVVISELEADELLLLRAQPNMSLQDYRDIQAEIRRRLQRTGTIILEA